MNDAELLRRARDAAALAVGLHRVMPAMLARLDEFAGGYASSVRIESDRTAGHTTVTDERGVPVPAVADPTGEAALHPSVSERAVLERVLTVVHRELVALDRLRQSVTATARHDPGVGCELHAIVDVWRTPLVQMSDVGGRLSRKRTLCRWCHDFVGRAGRIPDRRELERNVAGERVS